MKALKVFVEGGAKGALASECRRAFGKLVARAGFGGRMPTFVACGSRGEAFDRFCHALGLGEQALLLVDSEDAVAFGAPAWDHVKQRVGDGWVKPEGVDDDGLHFMVCAMEAWLLADRDAVARYYGKGFDPARLPPPGRPPESIHRDELVRTLDLAARDTKKRGYGKGAHSFEILASVDPERLASACPWARRFFDVLGQRLA